MAEFEVGFYYKVTVHVEADTKSEALEKARNLDLDVNAFSANDSSVTTEFVEFIDPDIESIIKD
jgi:hypothetical protein